MLKCDKIILQDLVVKSIRMSVAASNDFELQNKIKNGF